MINNDFQLAGKTLPLTQFSLQESEKNIEIGPVLDVLEGRLAAYCVRDFVPDTVCQQIYNNFWSSPLRSPRYGDGEDGVEGYILGASHIEKTIDEYLNDVDETQTHLKALYHGTSNPIEQFKSFFTEQTAIQGRAACYQNRFAGDSKAVYWNSQGEFLLQPHEDLAQLRCSKQAGFEIQEVQRVMAINIYIRVPQHAGQLKLWNIEPNDSSRDMLQLTYSGFPYPPKLLTSHDALTIAIGTGDLCLINGNLIHAVLRGHENALAKDRLLVTCFSGLNAQGELLWWT